MSVIKYLFIYCSDDLGRLYGPTRALYVPSSSGLARALAIAICSSSQQEKETSKGGHRTFLQADPCEFEYNSPYISVADLV